MQTWSTEHVPDLIATDHRPSGSPDSNRLDCRSWNALEETEPVREDMSEYLKASIVKAASEISLTAVREAVDERSVQTKGDRFE